MRGAGERGEPPRASRVCRSRPRSFRERRQARARLSTFTLAPAAPALTDRERSIAELVAAGGSNKEVAAALFLSAKIAEDNLSRISAKLGVRSRTELGRALSRGA